MLEIPTVGLNRHDQKTTERQRQRDIKTQVNSTQVDHQVSHRLETCISDNLSPNSSTRALENRIETCINSEVCINREESTL